jgi:hypothetical protein
VVLSGGAVSTVAFYTPLHGPEQPLFTVSRLTDVPAVYLFIAIIVALVSRYLVLLRRLDEELCNDNTYCEGFYASIWWFFSALTAFILAVLAYKVATEFQLRLGQLQAYAGLYTLGTCCGMLWGLVGMFWSKLFLLKLRLAYLTNAVIMFVAIMPIGFVDGWLLALFAASVASFASAVGLLIVASVGRLFIWVIVSIFRKQFYWRTCLCIPILVGRWLIAADITRKN